VGHNVQLRAGVARLRTAEEGEAAANASVAELEARAHRADTLLHKLEDRRCVCMCVYTCVCAGM